MEPLKGRDINWKEENRKQAAITQGSYARESGLPQEDSSDPEGRDCVAKIISVLKKIAS